MVNPLAMTVSQEVEERLLSPPMYEELGKRTEKNREEHLCPTRSGTIANAMTGGAHGTMPFSPQLMADATSSPHHGTKASKLSKTSLVGDLDGIVYLKVQNKSIYCLGRFVYNVQDLRVKYIGPYAPRTAEPAKLRVPPAEHMGCFVFIFSFLCFFVLFLFFVFLFLFIFLFYCFFFISFFKFIFCFLFCLVSFLVLF